MPVCRIFDSTGKELTQCTTDIYLPHSKIFFGRSSKCEICLKAFAESSISRMHFYIQESLTGQWEIYDNNSRAGVILDSKKVPSAPLYDGTIIRFGNLFLAFGEKGVPSHYRLKWTDTSGQSKYGYLWEGVNSIGASRDNYVTVREGDVSRFHATIIVCKDQVTIEPVNTILNVEINGEHVEGSSKLHGGDTFTMGSFPVELEYVDTVAKRTAIVMSSEDVERRNRNAKSERRTAIIVGYCLLGTGILLLIALGLKALTWLPSGN